MPYLKRHLFNSNRSNREHKPHTCKIGFTPIQQEFLLSNSQTQMKCRPSVLRLGQLLITRMIKMSELFL